MLISTKVFVMVRVKVNKLNLLICLDDINVMVDVVYVWKYCDMECILVFVGWGKYVIVVFALKLFVFICFVDKVVVIVVFNGLLK